MAARAVSEDASSVEPRPMHAYRRAKKGLIRTGMTPGLYRFQVRTTYWEHYVGESRRNTTESLVTDWVEVSPVARHLVEFEAGRVHLDLRY